MSGPDDRPIGPATGPGPVSHPDDAVDDGIERPAVTFRRVRMLRQDGYRPRRSEASAPRHLKLLD